jgi:hypothetical protein
MKSFMVVIRRETTTIALSLCFTFIALLILAFIRFFDNSTFLFLQVLLVTLLISLIIYGLSGISSHRLKIDLRGRELAITSIVFLVLSFSVLNIDRSRSFYLIKWISISGQKGTTTTQISDKFNLSPQDSKDLTQRVKEQKESRTIVEVDGKLHLTLLGKVIVTVSSWIAQLTNLNGYPRA